MLRYSDKDIQVAALNVINTLCGYGIFFCSLIISDSYPLSANMRTKFTSVNGIERLIEKLIEILNDPDLDLRETALNSVKALCVHRMTFCSLTIY